MVYPYILNRECAVIPAPDLAALAMMALGRVSMSVTWLLKSLLCLWQRPLVLKCLTLALC
jgi:hypothetical protein